jgi:Fe-S cluster assembly iron-binding protein IscA
VPVVTHQPSCWYFTLSKAFFHSQKEEIDYQFESFISDYLDRWGEDSIQECDVILVWKEFEDILVIDPNLNDCYNIRNIPGVDDQFVILREFCSCHDPAVDAEWEIDNYIDYIKDHPEEFFRVYKQYEDRVDRTNVRSSWGSVSGGYFTGIVNGIPVPDYTSALYSCKERLIKMRNPSNRDRQTLLSAFPKDESYFTTIFSRHIASYHGDWIDKLNEKDPNYESMRPLRSRWDGVLVKPTRSFAIGDRHGKVNLCLVPGCGGWSNSRLGTYATKEEVKDVTTHKDKRDKAVKITVQKSEERLKKESEERRKKREAKIKTAEQRREDELKKKENIKLRQFEASLRALEQLKIDYVEVDSELLLDIIVHRIAYLRPYKVNIQRLKNIKHYFASDNIKAQEKLNKLIVQLEDYFYGKKEDN